MAFLTIKLPQKATDDFMDIIKKRKEALKKVAEVNIDYDEEKTREAVLKNMKKLFLYSTGWQDYPEEELNELIDDIIAMVYMGEGFPVNITLDEGSEQVIDAKSLVIRLKDKPELFIVWKEYLGDNTLIRYRFDDGEVQKSHWQQSASDNFCY